MSDQLTPDLSQKIRKLTGRLEREQRAVADLPSSVSKLWRRFGIALMRRRHCRLRARQAAALGWRQLEREWEAMAACWTDELRHGLQTLRALEEAFRAAGAHPAGASRRLARAIPWEDEL